MLRRVIKRRSDSRWPGDPIDLYVLLVRRVMQDEQKRDSGQQTDSLLLYRRYAHTFVLATEYNVDSKLYGIRRINSARV